MSLNETGRPPERPADSTITAPSLPPRIVIALSLEGRPRVYEEAMHEGDSRRLEDWIKSSPALLKLLTDALALSARKAA